MGVVLKRVGNFVLDTIFPIECLGCGKEGEWICGVCVARIPLEVQDFCFVCKKVSSGGRTCFSCRPEFPLEGVIRFFNYDEPLIKAGIRLAKYNYIRDIFEIFLRAAAPHLQEKFDEVDLDPRAMLFTPVPLHPRRQRERGFNQAEILAKGFAEHCAAPLATVLARRRMTLPQVDLQENDRRVNIKAAFSLTYPIPVTGQYVGLVDDVATTGSTLAEGARVLLQAGAKGVWGVVLAKG